MHSFVTLSLFKIGWLESSQDLIFMFEIQTTLTKIGQNFGKQKLSLLKIKSAAPRLIFSEEKNQSIHGSDQPKQCFTVLLKPNRTSQSKFCFPN